MKPHYSISIPKPCHEDWSKMTPNEKGKFCQSCSKTVVDFTKMNTKEIQDYMGHNKNQRICGYIKQSQLNAINLKIPEAVFYETWSFHKAFLLTLLLVMGTTLLNCSDSEGKKQKIDSIEVRETHQKSVDTILNKDETKEVKKDSIEKREAKTPKFEVKKQHVIEGLMIVGDIEREVVPIDSLEIKTPPFCPEPEKDDLVVGFLAVDHPAEFMDTPVGLSNPKKKEYLSNKISKIVEENFNIKIASDYALTGGQRINTQFKIDKNGFIKDIKARAQHPALEKEAIRVIKLLPKFKPAKQGGRNIGMVYTLPIAFMIED